MKEVLERETGERVEAVVDHTAWPVGEKIFALTLCALSVALLHERDGRTETLATRVEIADSLLSQTRGLMFRRSIREEYALVFRFETAKTRDVHMLFVFFPIDVCWLVDGVVQRVERMNPFVSYARAEADTILELPAGAAENLSVGDRIVLEE